MLILINIYSGYGIGFNSRSYFLFPNFEFDWGKNVTNFGVNKISITHSDNSYLV